MKMKTIAAFISKFSANTLAPSSDQPLNLSFKVEIDSLFQGSFAEVSGLSMEIEIEEYQEGGVNDTVHALPKAVKYQNIALKKGSLHSDWMWDWIQQVAEGEICKKNGQFAHI